MGWASNRHFGARLLLAFLGACFFAGGCSGRREAVQPRGQSLVDGLVTLVPYTSPAQWLHFPRRVPSGLQQVELGAQTLFLDELGQRWLRVPQGRALGSPTVAPEPLVGAGHEALGFWFLGQSGTTYTSVTPLGDFVRTNQAPEPFVRVTSSKRSLMGVSASARAFVSHDYGGSWEPTLVGETVVDVGVLPNGHGLALLSPERLLTTPDHGRTWQPLDTQAVGATHIIQVGGKLELLSLLGRFSWSPGKPLVASAPDPSNEPLKLVVSEVHARAVPLVKGEAVVAGRKYYEVEAGDGAVGVWFGELGRALERVETNLRSCRRPRLVVGASAQYLLCFSDSDKVGRFKLLQSRDAGRTFDELPHQLYGAAPQVRAVAWRNDLVLTGICSPDAEPDGCSPRGVFFIPERSHENKSVERLALPMLAGSALALSVAPATARLFVVGPHRKGGKAAMFSTTRPDVPFELTELPQLAVGERREDLSAGVEAGVWSQEGMGSFSFPNATPNGHVLVVVDENGKLIQAASGPTGRASLTSAGLRALAIDGRGNRVWESMDGGTTWLEVPAPTQSLCKSDEATCDVAAVCLDVGCLVAQGWLRSGWGGSALLAQEPAKTTTQSNTWATPIICKLADDAAWQSVARGELPGASRASLGGVDWFAHAVDLTNASVAAYEMPMSYAGTRASLRSYELFEPRSDANRWVVYSSHQTEGVAALRHHTDSGVVDVAWRNLFSSTTTYRAKLKDTHELASSVTRFSARAGQPGLVSIGLGGIFVRLGPHEHKSVTQFVSENGELQSLPLLTWPSLVSEGTTEMVMVGGVPVALKLFRGGAILAGAQLVDQQWQVGAVSVGLDERVFDVKQSFELTYGSKGPLYYFLQESPFGLRATLFPLQAHGRLLGAPGQAPTQQDLNASVEPRLCTPGEVAASPRIITRPQRGVRYPVMVEHASEPLRFFVTNFAVTHGAPSGACVAVFDAKALSRIAGEEQAALVRPDPAAASWLFRRVAGTAAFDYRPMTCHYDASAKLPSEIVERAEARL